MTKRPNQDIHCSLNDWENKEVLLPQSVLDIHLFDSNHLESFSYLNELKAGLKNPYEVRQSKNRTNTKLVYITLNGRRHLYLCAVIRYGSFFSRFLGKKNYIVTFYGTDKLKKGKTLWKK